MRFTVGTQIQRLGAELVMPFQVQIICIGFSLEKGSLTCHSILLEKVRIPNFGRYSETLERFRI